MSNANIISEEYEPGVPGRACLECSSAWPANEPDGCEWHHRHNCSAVASPCPCCDGAYTGVEH